MDASTQFKISIVIIAEDVRKVIVVDLGRIWSEFEMREEY